MSITALARLLIGGVRLVGPALVALALGLLLAELLSRPGRARLRLAHFGMSAAQPSLLRRMLAGALVPTLGVAALCVSLSLEQEVREGPNRMVDRLQSQAGPNPPAWILESGTSHFMNDSRLPHAVAVAAQVDNTGQVAQLWEQLVTISSSKRGDDTGMLLGLPTGQQSPFSPQVTKKSAKCHIVNNACLLTAHQAVADTSVYPVGTKLVVRGQTLQVVANTAQPYSLINRAVVFTTQDAFTEPNGTVDPPYAEVVGGPGAPAHAARIVRASGQRGVQVLTSEAIKQANATFWAGNGTPLLLLVIVLSTAFCGVALYTARRALQERERMSSGTLQALGLRVSQVCRIDLLRALVVTLTATALAVGPAIGIIKVVDLGMLGFHATLTPGLLLAAAGLLVLANLLGTGAMWLRVRNLSVVEAISQ